MPNTASIVAPPYHVQSTAKELRDRFPYFAYYDSVSALWSQKWRPPCAKGIYPFMDGKVEDFDLIFAELVRLSGDQTKFLYQPDEYAPPFFPAAEKLVAMAGSAEASGNKTQARDFYLRGAAVYRIARFPINRSPRGQEAWELGKAAYIRCGQYMDPLSVPINVPFTHADEAAGDRSVAIQTFLRLPVGEKPKNGWPVLLFIGGLDAYKTDHTFRTQIHVERGLVVLSFEIPGTGDCPAAPNDPASPDRLMSSVLDWVEAQATHYGFDTSRIVARGVSTGGHYAMRVAHTHAERLFAAVAEGGACHHMFDPGWIDAQNQMSYPFALADALAYKFGYRGADPIEAYKADAGKFSLLATGVLDRPSCQLLAINGMEDTIFPIEDSILVGLSGRNKELLARANRDHMGDPGAEDIVHEWIARVLAGKP